LQLYVADLHEQLGADMNTLKDVMRDQGYELATDAQYDDFVARMRSDERSKPIDDSTLRMSFEKVRFVFALGRLPGWLCIMDAGVMPFVS
jgi:hypothetical protein